MTKLKQYNKQLIAEKRGLEALLKEAEDSDFTHQVSHRIYKNLRFHFDNRQKEQAADIMNSLRILKSNLSNVLTSPLNQKYMNNLELCCHLAQQISIGSLNQTTKEPINLKTILDRIFLLFIERIQNSHILLKVNCSKKLNFKSDLFFIEFILINLIGKSLYRVPNDGKIFIKAFLKNHALYQDKVTWFRGLRSRNKNILL